MHNHPPRLFLVSRQEPPCPQGPPLASAVPLCPQGSPLPRSMPLALQEWSELDAEVWALLHHEDAERRRVC